MSQMDTGSWPDDLMDILPAGCSLGDDVDTLWYAIARAARLPRVLHMGSRRSDPDHSTMAEAAAWFQSDADHYGTDLEPGLDVNPGLVCDAHELSRHWQGGVFDFVVSRSVMEHLERPWDVVREMAEVTRRGGWAFIQTHQTYILHEYPSDYYRFSVEALASLFSPSRGWRTVRTGYYFPCKITCEEVPQPYESPAYLNVNCLALRI